MKILANDSMFYSYTLNKHYIGNNDDVFKENTIFEELNKLKLINKGFMSSYGDYSVLTKKYRRFKASSKDIDKKETIEYLHCLVKN